MTPPVLTDSQVIAGSLNRPDEFAQLFERHAVALWHYLVVRVGRQDADDLLSEVFARAFANRHRFRAEMESAKPWLYGIASNLAKQRARSLSYNVKRLDRARGATPTDPPDPADEAIRLADSAAEWPKIASALATLNAGDRDVVGLHVIAGLSQAETAEVLDIPVGTVKSRLNRARRKLETLLDPPDPNGGLS